MPKIVLGLAFTKLKVMLAVVAWINKNPPLVVTVAVLSELLGHWNFKLPLGTVFRKAVDFVLKELAPTTKYSTVEFKLVYEICCKLWSWPANFIFCIKI